VRIISHDACAPCRRLGLRECLGGHFRRPACNGNTSVGRRQNRLATLEGSCCTLGTLYQSQATRLRGHSRAAPMSDAHRTRPFAFAGHEARRREFGPQRPCVGKRRRHEDVREQQAQQGFVLRRGRPHEREHRSSAARRNRTLGPHANGQSIKRQEGRAPAVSGSEVC
jgi:hypothetical protein